MSSVKLARVCQKFAGLISFDAAGALRGRLTGTLPWAAKQFRLQIVAPYTRLSASTSVARLFAELFSFFFA
jgi:hypothetical protein